MPRTCTICRHASREAIDHALADRQPVCDIAALFRVSPDALQRHKAHVGQAIVKAAERREENLGESLYSDLQNLRVRTLNLLEQAEQSGQAAATVALIREARQNVLALSELAAGAGSTDGEPALAVRIERVGLPDTCPHCGKPLEPVAHVSVS